MFEFQNSNSKASAIPSSSGSLKFSSFCTDIGLGMAMWHPRSRSKVLDSLPGILRTPKKNLKTLFQKKKIAMLQIHVMS